MVKQKNKLLIAVSILCIISVATMLIVLNFTKSEEASDNFMPPSFEQNAIQGIPDVPDDLGWSEVDAQVYKASVCGIVVLEGDRADVWFTNPSDSSVWLKLRVLDERGNIIGETGIIRPGEYVQRITFTTIPNDGDTIGLKVMGYEPETYYSAGSVTLNTTVRGGIT